MDPKEDNTPRIVWVIFGNPHNHPFNMDPTILAWLKSFLEEAEALKKSSSEERSDTTEGNINLDEFEDLWDLDEMGCPNEMADLEFIDGLVTGDHHPEAYDLIMNAFLKHQEK